MRFAVRLPFAALVSIAVLILPFAALADSGSESQFVADTNSARSSHGLRHYAVSGDLNSVARRWAAHMAARHQLAHNPSFTSEVCCWTHIGENVGVGPSVSAIQRAFMASSPHRANILSSSCTQVGIGTARGSDGRLYVDELFRRPTHATAHTATHSAPRANPTHHVTPTVVRTRPAVVHRVSRSAIRHPRAVVHAPRHPDVRGIFLARLAAARRASADGYGDPVGGALAYLRVLQQLGG